MIINTNENGLRIELHGREQVWAMRAKIDVIRDTITNIRFEPTFQEWRKWEVRIPGTAVPRLLFSGSYWTENGWDFLYIKKPRGILKPIVNDVLVIETNQNRYCRIIVSVTAEEAGRIIKWWNQKPKTQTKPEAKQVAKKKAKTSTKSGRSPKAPKAKA